MAVLLSFLATGCALSWGQSSGQTDGQADAAASPSAAEPPEANPARPTIASPAKLTPVGYVQMEQGLVQANDSPRLDRQFSISQVTKITVHSRLMFQFLSQPFSASVADGVHSRAPGDLQAGAQVVLVNQADRGPTIAAGYVRRVRSGDAADLDIGGFSDSALILASGDPAGFHYDTNFIVSVQDAGVVRRAQFGGTISVSHPLWWTGWGLTGELWRFTQPLVTETHDFRPHPRSNATGTLWAVSYTVRPNLVLDAAFDHGLTATSTQWQGLAGFTYLFPHRLWKSREPAAAAKH